MQLHPKARGRSRAEAQYALQTKNHLHMQLNEMVKEYIYIVVLEIFSGIFMMIKRMCIMIMFQMYVIND